MSRFLHPQYAGLEAYTPGEQPRDRQYIKLNTNESPYPPAPAVLAALTEQDLADLRLYSDPEGTALRAKLAELYGVEAGQVFLSNGSDDILNFAFMAFGADGAVFPALTYSFYPVFANLHGVAYETVPLREDFTLDVAGMQGKGKLTVFPNPNAPTGIALPLDQVEAIVAANPDHVVVVDEAYVDFGTESALSLLDRYPNLLVVRTFSKGRSLAGLRVGYAVGNQNLIAALNSVKNSFNSYPVDRLAQAGALGAIRDMDYFRATTTKIINTRACATCRLRKLGFTVCDSSANFLFVCHQNIPGKTLLDGLRQRGILVRWWDKPRISNYLRITVGTDEDMKALCTALKEILDEQI